MITVPHARLRPGALTLAALLIGLPSFAPAALGPVDLAPTAEAPAAPPEFTLVTIAAARTALQKELAATRTELAELPDGMSTEAARWLSQETALLEQIDAVYAAQQRTAQRTVDLTREAAEIEERTRNLRPPEATLQPPHDLSLLDELYTERDELEQMDTVLQRDVTEAGQLVEEAQDRQEEKDRHRRAVRGAAVATVSRGNLRLAELESRLAQQTVILREQTLKTLKLQRSLIAPKRKLLEPRLEWLQANLTLGPVRSPAAQAKQSQRTVELERAIALAGRDAEAVTQVVVATERRANQDTNPEELGARRANRQTADLTLSVLTAQRERLTDPVKPAELRHRVLSGSLSASELRTLAADNQAVLEQLSGERRRQAIALLRSREELQDWHSRLARAAAADERPALWAVERVKRLTAWIALSEVEMAELEARRIERSRLQTEIGDQVNLFSWKDARLGLVNGVAAAWNYELFSVQDEPVRVRTVLVVILLVVFGYHGAHWVTALAARVVLRRIGLNTGQRAAWQTLWFYGLFLAVLGAAFNLFHISLTQFSLVTGALAVGIGFGSQNLIGNFISGIILLIERPVSQGDVIEIDGRQVTVERLGARSTIVRTLENTHMIVPNSRLLEQPVVNWTLSDDVVRKCIRVGVAYESSSRTVATLLHGVLASDPRMMPEPPPRVNFSDFGESSLIFDVYFWVRLADAIDAEDETRHRIAEAFAKEGIVMAFPQRDVHLGTTEPLRVVITPPATTPGDDTGKPPVV